MSMTGRIILFSMFLLVFSFSISTMPLELMNPDYQPFDYYIPSEVDLVALQNNYSSTEHELVKDSTVEFQLSNPDGTLVNVDVRYDQGIYNYIVVDSKAVYGMGTRFFPLVYKSELIANWDAGDNHSELRLSNDKSVLYAYFEDNNDTDGIDIADAYDDDDINCTLVVTQKQQTGLIGSMDVILALLSFRLPSIFTTLNPLFATVISIIFYVPLAFIFYWVVNTFFHGGV